MLDSSCLDKTNHLFGHQGKGRKKRKTRNACAVAIP